MRTGPAFAVYPAPWPDNGNADVNAGWTPYTLLGTSIQDQPSATDGSTGGTTPTQSADFISAGLPTFYIAFSQTNQVLYVRMRLANSPLTPTPNGASNDDPFNNVTWSMLIDSDGDGFKEFLVRLNGDLGGPGNPIDDLEVYYDNSRSQGLPTGALPIFVLDSGIFPDSDGRATVFDFGRSRGIEAPTPTQGHFLDFQVPLSSFTVNGTQLITQNTPVSFGFGTSNSNTNPFQKDAGFNGTFSAAIGDPFPFGDPGTLSGGPTQNPFVTSLTATGCGPAQLSATVMDALTVSGGLVTSTIDRVEFFYQPDFDNNGVPDTGTTPISIGTTLAPSPTDITLWTFTWNNTGVGSGHYLLFAVATDKQSNQGTSAFTHYDLTCGGVTVSGTVYNDANHNGNLDNAETGTGLTGLFVKLKPNASATATIAASVDPSTGAYNLTGVAPGTYTLILDNNSTLTDIAPFLPGGYIGTQASSGQISNVVVNTLSVVAQNFGLFNGSLLSGRVFNDNGAGGGIANNGILDGGEIGLGGVQVRLTNAAGSTVFDTTTTDGAGNYTLYVPAAQNGQQLSVVETNAANYLSTGGTVGNTGGTYNRTTDATTFTNAVGTTYTNVNFGDVPVNIFTNDGTQNGVPGGTVIYPHVFTSGSAGSVTFSTTNIASPTNTLWQNVIYLDSNANGVLEAGEPQITAPIAVTANQQVAVLVKEFVPANAPIGARDVTTITALFTYSNANPALTSTLTHTDTTTVATETGLVLSKSVNRATAKSGDLISYTITYRNASGTPLSTLIINDTTPAFTVFVSQTNSALPANLTGVTATTPAVNAFGAMKWTFAGTLAPNATGTVTFVVRLQ